jgi:hypothetical protein
MEPGESGFRDAAMVLIVYARSPTARQLTTSRDGTVRNWYAESMAEKAKSSSHGVCPGCSLGMSSEAWTPNPLIKVEIF